MQADCEDVRVAEPVVELGNLLFECEGAVAVLGGRWPGLRQFLRVATSAQVPAVLVLVRQQVASESENPQATSSELLHERALRLGGGAMLEEQAREALEMGARAVLYADISDSALKAALVAARAGLVVIDSGLQARVGSGPVGPTPRESSSPAPRYPRQLTMRERKILSLIASGVSNKGIARKLGVSVNTVKFHLTAAFQKLGATTRAEAVTEAIRRGELAL